MFSQLLLILIKELVRNEELQTIENFYVEVES